MPSRWFIPISGLDPARVKLEFVHAAFSRWFDAPEDEVPTLVRGAHGANDKPYALSPPRLLGGQVGVEIAVLNRTAEDLLHEAATATPKVRLGSQTRSVGSPRLLAAQSYAELAAGPYGTRWDWEFATPTTFRSGDRSTPLPSVTTILDGLMACWNRWHSSGEQACLENRAAVWVSDLDLRSQPMTSTIRDRSGAQKPIHLSAVTGTMTIRCDDPGTCRQVAPLLRLARFAGVGSMRGRGLGVVNVRERGVLSEIADGA